LTKSPENPIVNVDKKCKRPYILKCGGGTPEMLIKKLLDIAVEPRKKDEIATS
jgi:hypothetical protein